MCNGRKGMFDETVKKMGCGMVSIVDDDLHELHLRAQQLNQVYLTSTTRSQH